VLAKENRWGKLAGVLTGSLPEDSYEIPANGIPADKDPMKGN